METGEQLETEWVPCPECGYPVIDLGDVLEDVIAFGFQQYREGVEHECRER